MSLKWLMFDRIINKMANKLIYWIINFIHACCDKYCIKLQSNHMKFLKIKNKKIIMWEQEWILYYHQWQHSFINGWKIGSKREEKEGWLYFQCFVEIWNDNMKWLLPVFRYCGNNHLGLYEVVHIMAITTSLYFQCFVIAQV